MTLTLHWSNVLETYTATFANDVCASLVHTLEYYDQEDADYNWDYYSRQYANCTREGNTIIIDLTNEWSGKSKAEVRRYFEQIREEYSSDYE